MGSTGAHSHDVTVSTIGNHSHTLTTGQGGDEDQATQIPGNTQYHNPGNTSTSAAGAHTHTVTIGSGQSAHTHSISIANSSGGTETRPRNVALLACIKY